MKHNHILLIAMMAFLAWGCKDDLLYNTVEDGPEGEGVKAFLSLSVNDFIVSSDGTRDAEPSETEEVATDYENRIDNIWVFQYRASDGSKLQASYHTISNQNNLERIAVTLTENVSSYICVVANTGSSSWGTGTGFATYEGMKTQALASPEPIMYSEYTDLSKIPSIPMEGSVTATVKTGSVINVGVQRMYAKIKISFDTHELDMTPKSIEINNIPNYCRIKSVGEGVAEKDSAVYDKNTQWITRSYDATSIPNISEYIVYIPENIQGERVNPNSYPKDSVAPSKALVVRTAMNYNFQETHPDKGFSIYLDEERNYTVYPGGNIKTNFNVKRNNVYRVKLNVFDAEQFTPSSNCFVVEPGNNYAFEPYYRLEKGGEYDFSNYLDHEGKTGEKISKVDIIWQTKDAIGNNVNGDKVWFKLNTKDPYHSKIVVRTQKEGNALIGAYNAAGEIIWSWHLWIRKDDPSNVGNAIVYTTYAWDKNGIKNNARVPGYAIMPCNLGALSNAPEDQPNAKTADDWYCKEYRTYGMLYQWGRKDPFPPLKRNIDVSGTYAYSNDYVRVYDNSNTLIVMTTMGHVSKKDELFNSKYGNDEAIGSTFASRIKYSINHPTIHISGANSLLSSSTWNDPAYYIHQGNWLPVNDEKLWGGLPITASTEKYTAYTINENVRRAIWRNYGPDKTIFDPCPTGWRVPPGDLWLGFTHNGLNVDWGSTEENMKNWLNVPSYFNMTYMVKNPGYWICLDGWHTSDKKGHTFFPTQGSRLASGQPLHGGICGNYHNATVDNSDTYIQRVNILHFHRNYKVNTFEDQVLYYNKSVAGPIRCVRDRK